MTQRIDGKRVKLLRDNAKLTQEELAGRADVSKDTISRIESGKQTSGTANTLKKIARALNVAPDILIGDGPMPTVEDSSVELPGEPPGSQWNIRIGGAARNAFALAARRYRIPAIQILEIAPFLFVAAAERSLARRSKGLEELEKALNLVDEAGNRFLHLPNTIAPTYEAVGPIRAERASIADLDILAERLDRNIHYTLSPRDEAYSKIEHNPFVIALQEEAPKEPEIAEIELFSRSLMLFKVCRPEALELAGGDEELADVIQEGWAPLHEMPRELRAKEALPARVAWLREKAVARNAAIEEGSALFDSLLSKVEGGKDR